ncbi:MAG: Selenide, water dikinase [Bacteroidota bacterium]|jgi:selenide,water dikinase
MIKLTAYSHGAGCGCKISPEVLEEIVKFNSDTFFDKNLLVGNNTKDDAAVYDLGNGEGIISTTDFFMPIVDDPFTFGQIAATNAISDIYAMGGTPIMAIAILGWPIDKIPADIANQVLEGGRYACKMANIALAGGHSIDAPEPIFGLAVTGRIPTEKVKTNDAAKSGDLLYLSKPLGVGIITTAQKKGIVAEEDIQNAVNNMTKLNVLGQYLGNKDYVNAITDVTGFGLFGHLIELCEGAGLSAKINFNQLPLLPNIFKYLDQKSFPGGTTRNLKSYGHKIQENLDETTLRIGADPQTSGGLLISVNPEFQKDFEEYCFQMNHHPQLIGSIIDKKEKSIYIE